MIKSLRCNGVARYVEGGQVMGVSRTGKRRYKLEIGDAYDDHKKNNTFKERTEHYGI